jgi:hypothetical protein
MKRFAPLIIVMVLAAAACSPSNVSRGAPPTTQAQSAINLVVLGSDEAFGAGLSRDDRNRGSWPQILFHDSFPARATLVDLATAGATADDVVRRQVPNALQLAPTIAVVWTTGDADIGSPVAGYSDGLARALTALRAAGTSRVLVAAGPSGHPDYDIATRQVAEATGATYVDLSSLDAPLDLAGHQAAARLIAQALGPLN